MKVGAFHHAARDGDLAMPSYEERIRAIRSELSPSFQILADFLLDSYVKASFLTATELAHTLDLDPATVVRFAQRLDYAGYPELQREIRQKVEQELLETEPAPPGTSLGAADAALAEVAQNLDLTRRSFPVQEAETLITALDEAERVVVIAEGLATGPARSLAAWLEGAGYTVHVAGHSAAEIASALVGARKRDLALAVEVLEGSPIAARALREASKAGLRTAALVAAPSSPVAASADLVLAGYAHPDPGVRQVVVEALVHALVKLLMRDRPGRFSKVAERVARITQRIAGDQG